MISDIYVWKKEFRKSKEWKEKRLELIKKRKGKCEWCKSKEVLIPAHQNVQIKILFKIIKRKEEFLLDTPIINSQPITYYRIFQLYLEQNLVKQLPEKYISKNRNYLSGFKINKGIWNWLFYESKEIKEILNPVLEKTNETFKEYYSNFDNCLLLCRRCSFSQSKGLLLCKCKKKYYYLGNETCPNCYPKKKKREIAKRKREREKREKEIDELFLDTKEYTDFEKEVDELEEKQMKEIEKMG